eukprot:m.263650 g.263650  ORF g.263650 m.263650 type:complete len:322 (-) comp27118_c0_seq1:204-1169(-)
MDGGARLSVRQMCLLALVFETTAVQLSARYSRKQAVLYFTTTAVVCIEALKILLSLAVLAYTEGGLTAAISAFMRDARARPELALKMLVPACLYTIQNNILLMGAGYLDAGLFTLLRQLKIPITAILWVIVMRTSLSRAKWGALSLLVAGVALAQSGDYLLLLLGGGPQLPALNSSASLGAFYVILSCVTSGIAAVYFEKVIKSAEYKPSLWILNVFLAAESVVLGLLGCYFDQGAAISEHGFFHGYTPLVLAVIVIHASDGLVVALAVKYSDNIAKAFATAVAVVLTCAIAAYWGDFHVTSSFLAGAVMVATAAYWYSTA